MNKYRIEYSGFQSNSSQDGQPFDNVLGNKTGRPAVIYASGRAAALRQLADDLAGSYGGVPTVLTITLVGRVEPVTRTIVETPIAGIQERY